jgi:hypothetical protein
LRNEITNAVDHWSKARLQSNGSAHVLLPGQLRHFHGFLQSISQWPLAQDGLTGFKCGHHEFVMKGNFDRDHHQVDVWMRH